MIKYRGPLALLNAVVSGHGPMEQTISSEHAVVLDINNNIRKNYREEQGDWFAKPRTLLRHPEHQFAS